MARILIVDDSPTEIRKISTILERNNHEVITADNGADGVAVARAEQPDIILMDVVMPGLNGFQATRQLTRTPETAEIPVIIVTLRTRKQIGCGERVRGRRGIWLNPLQKMG